MVEQVRFRFLCSGGLSAWAANGSSYCTLYYLPNVAVSPYSYLFNSFAAYFQIDPNPNFSATDTNDLDNDSN